LFLSFIDYLLNPIAFRLSFSMIQNSKSLTDTGCAANVIELLLDIYTKYKNQLLEQLKFTGRQFI
jgi:hypothetical protein